MTSGTHSPSHPRPTQGNRQGSQDITQGQVVNEGVVPSSLPVSTEPLAQTAPPASPPEPAVSMLSSLSSLTDASADYPKATHIEPGRALALVDFSPPASSLSERLVRMAYRIGIPGTYLTKPVGKKPRNRLLATVTNTLPGHKPAGMAIRAGHFLVHGAKTPIVQVDFSGTQRLAPPLEKVVHSFSWLTDLETCAPREQAAPLAERIVTAWMQANPQPPARPSKSRAWSIGYTGARLMQWLTHAPLILSGDKALRSRVLNHITVTARWLDRHVTQAEDRLAEVAGWAAIIAAGLLLPDGTPRRLYGEAGLLKALGEMIGDDGGVLSRSPLGQMEAIAILVRLRNCYHATRRDTPEAIERVMQLLVPPLLALVHGDGALGSWQGGWAVSHEDVENLIKASGVRARPLRDVRQWGYQRALAHKTILQFDTAPPPMPSEARFGCASTLAFEMSYGPHRLIVNCGGAASGGGLIPQRLEQGLRATAAHSTLTLDDANSTAILSDGLIGAGVAEVGIDRKTLTQENGGTATRLEASHNGYASRYGLVHQRILLLRDDGSELLGEDVLVPSGRKGKRSDFGFAIRFHLGPEVDVTLSEDAMGAALVLPDGSYWHMRSTSEPLSLEDSIWVDGNGHPQATQQLVIQGTVSRSGGAFGWHLKKMNDKLSAQQSYT